MRRLAPIVALVLAAFAAGARSADEVPAPPPRATPPDTVAVGGPVPSELRVELLPPASEEVPLLSLGGDVTKPLVVLFWSSRCPVCRRYAPVVKTLAKDYDGRARIVVVSANANETAAEALEFVGGCPASVVGALDRRQTASAKLASYVTPTALVIDATGVLRYRGPIDDDRRARRRDTADHLRVALDAVIAAKPVENPEPRAFGSSVRGQAAERR